MSKAAYKKVAAGLREALAVAKGEMKPARLYVPSKIDVKAIRRRTRLSQDAFAMIFGFSVHQIRHWEQTRVCHLGAMRAYLLLIDRDPKTVIALLRRSRAKRRAA